jgi:hypothetical protein
MARGNPKGGGNLSEQIDRLKKAVGREGVKAAQEIVEGYEPDVIKLAFKMVPKGQGANAGLGKRLEAMLAQIPKSRRAEVEADLLAARQKVTG